MFLHVSDHAELACHIKINIQNNISIELVRIIEIDGMDSKLQFDVRLQIALRRNAIGIMSHSPYPERFREYIKERDIRIRTMLNLEDEDIRIVYGGKEIYPDYG